MRNQIGSWRPADHMPSRRKLAAFTDRARVAGPVEHALFSVEGGPGRDHPPAAARRHRAQPPQVRAIGPIAA